ncbi:hypothetical protein BJY59DRAFT_554794 [Rhodotorula toruloides]
MSTVKKLGKRPVRACTECVRLKSKCDRTYPCSSCIKRGKSALCAPAEESSLPARSTSSPLVDESGSVVGTSSEVRAGARSELALFRKTFESLQSRLSYLETLVGAAAHASDDAEPSSNLGRRQRTADEVDADGRASKRAAVQSPDEFTIEQNVLDSQRETPEFVGPRGLPFFDPQKQDSAMLLPSARNIFRLFPSRSSLAAVGPTKTVSDTLIHHCMVTTGALHPVASVPARTRHLELFWSVDGPAQYERCFAAWLASFFAQLAVGARLATSDVCRTLGMDASMLEELAGHWTDASIASLYYSNFLENRSMLALQAVGYLALSGRTAGNFRSINSLVDHSMIALRQLRLHLDIDAVPAPTVAPATEWETKASREIRKRVCWALCISHWLYSEHPFISPDEVKGAPPSDGCRIDPAVWRPRRLHLCRLPQLSFRRRPSRLRDSLCNGALAASRLDPTSSTRPTAAAGRTGLCGLSLFALLLSRHDLILDPAPSSPTVRSTLAGNARNRTDHAA